MLEKQIESRVVSFCKEHGLLCYKFSSPAHRGVPDRIIVGGREVLFLELKSPGKKPTALQLREIQKLKNAGMVAAWADSFEDARSIITNTFPTCVL